MMDPLEFWTICNANGILLSREQMEILKGFMMNCCIGMKR